MERVLEQVVWSTRAVNADHDPSQLDWEKLTDGHVWRLVQGLDYSMKTDSMSAHLYKKAKELELRIRIKCVKDVDPEAVVLQFIRP